MLTRQLKTWNYKNSLQILDKNRATIESAVFVFMRFDVITIFPHIFDSYFNESIIKRAQAKGLVKINIHNLRDYTIDKHKSVDDKPYGGGPGMVMMVEPIFKAVKKLKVKSPAYAKASAGEPPEI